MRSQRSAQSAVQNGGMRAPLGLCVKTAIVAFLLLNGPSLVWAAEAQKPELHYLLIDKSGSIVEKGLQVPIRGAVTRFLGKLPENAEVRIRLFDHEVTPPQRYGPPFGVGQLGLASDWIHSNYKPGNGNTLLYGAAGLVFREVLAEAGRFSAVNVVILTDGNNDPRALDGSKIPTPFASWADVEELSGKLKHEKEQEFVSILYTLSHTPESVPGMKSGIKHDNVPENQPFEIRSANAVPKADFDVHPRVIKVGDSVALFPMPGLAIITAYRWKLSDGRTSVETLPKFSFAAAGTYDATLSVEGPGGKAEKVMTGAVEVKTDAPPPAPKAEFIVHPQTVEKGQEILFTVISQAGIESYRWDFGDGGTSSDPQPRHAYSKPDAYTVTLDVSGPGGSDKVGKPAAVDVREPVNTPIARFSVSSMSGECPLTVVFKNESKGEIASRRWDFGDGTTTSDLANPSHTYNATGTFYPRLSVVNAQGVESKSPGDLPIKVKPPMPLWQKVALGALAALLAWVLVVVPLIVVPLIGLAGPRKGGKGYSMTASTGGTNYMHNLARKGSALRFLWPRTQATIGTHKSCDIRLATAQQSATPVTASIQRIAFSKRFRLKPAKGASVMKIQPGVRGVENKSAIGMSLILKQGHEFEFSSLRFKWEEPT